MNDSLFVGLDVHKATVRVLGKARQHLQGFLLRHRRGHAAAGNLDDFVLAYNFAKRLKTLKGLTPYEYICKIWTTEPKRFKLNPIHQMPGLNS